jgi:hypothetical protein
MAPGFSFREAMSGSYWLLDNPIEERAIAFTLDALARDVRRFASDKTLRLRGTVDAEGLATAKEVEGTLVFHLFDEGRLPYRVAFTGDDGRRYELCGQKEWRGLAPVESFALLSASLYDARGVELGRAKLRSDVRADWGRWMKSFRLHLFK